MPASLDRHGVCKLRSSNGTRLLGPRCAQGMREFRWPRAARAKTCLPTVGVLTVVRTARPVLRATRDSHGVKELKNTHRTGCALV
jgi:hypothetical protein